MFFPAELLPLLVQEAEVHSSTWEHVYLSRSQIHMQTSCGLDCYENSIFLSVHLHINCTIDFFSLLAVYIMK